MSGTVYTYPNLLEYFPDSFTLEIRSNAYVSTSGADGSTRTVEVPGARWFIELGYPSSGDRNRRRKLEAYWGKVRGQVNRVQLWHFVRPAPVGTMRGTPTISGAVAAGAVQFNINTPTGNTLLAGDMLRIGQQLIMNTTDATSASNLLQVNSNVPLRAAASNLDAVIWDRPVATFMTQSAGVPIPHGVNGDPAFSISLVETF